MPRMVPVTAIVEAVALGNAVTEFVAVAVVAAADKVQGQVSFDLGLQATLDVLALALASASAQAQTQPYWQDQENGDVEGRGMRQPVAGWTVGTVHYHSRKKLV